MDNYLYYGSLYKINTSNITDREDTDFYYFLNLLNENDNVLDIGANVGMMSLLIAKKAYNGKVFAFEPVPQNYKTLLKLISHYRQNNITAYCFALGNYQNKVTMVLPNMNHHKVLQMSYVMNNELNQNTPDFDRITVPQIPLDEIEEFKSLKINAIKIDVENYEYFVFIGAKNFIIKNKPIIYSEQWYGTQNQIDCFRFMQELNYKVYIFDGKNLTPFDPVKHQKLNFFFIPAEVVSHYADIN